VSRKPPFRADHVGSLLRTAALKNARVRHGRGEIDTAALTEIEDRDIKALIARLEAIGLRSITDGEYRRESWQTDFLRELDGVETVAVHVVWDPVWTPERLSQSARDALSMPLEQLEPYRERRLAQTQSGLRPGEPASGTPERGAA